MDVAREFDELCAYIRDSTNLWNSGKLQEQKRRLHVARKMRKKQKEMKSAKFQKDMEVSRRLYEEKLDKKRRKLKGNRAVVNVRFDRDRFLRKVCWKETKEDEFVARANQVQEEQEQENEELDGIINDIDVTNDTCSIGYNGSILYRNLSMDAEAGWEG